MEAEKKLDKIIVKGRRGGCVAYLEGQKYPIRFGPTADDAIGRLAVRDLLAQDALCTACQGGDKWEARIRADKSMWGKGPTRRRAIGDFVRNHGDAFGLLVVTR